MNRQWLESKCNLNSAAIHLNKIYSKGPLVRHTRVICMLAVWSVTSVFQTPSSSLTAMLYRPRKCAVKLKSPVVGKNSFSSDSTLVNSASETSRIDLLERVATFQKQTYQSETMISTEMLTNAASKRMSFKTRTQERQRVLKLRKFKLTQVKMWMMKSKVQLMWIEMRTDMHYNS